MKEIQQFHVWWLHDTLIALSSGGNDDEVNVIYVTLRAVTSTSGGTSFDDTMSVPLQEGDGDEWARQI